MTITIKAWTDNLGAQIGVRLYLQSSPDDQVGSDLILDRSTILDDLSAYYELAGVTLASGDYNAHLFVAADDVIAEDQELPTSTLIVTADSSTVWIGDAAVVGTGVLSTTAGFPEEIIKGDSWESAVGRGIALTLYNSDDEIMSMFGVKSPADDDFAWNLRFYPLPFSDGNTAVAEVSGDKTDWDATDPVAPYLLIELTTAITAALTVPSNKSMTDYIWHLVFTWTDYQYTAKGTTRVRALIGDPA